MAPQNGHGFNKKNKIKKKFTKMGDFNCAQYEMHCCTEIYPNDEMLLLAQKEKMYPLSFYTDFLYSPLVEITRNKFPIDCRGTDTLRRLVPLKLKFSNL